MTFAHYYDMSCNGVHIRLPTTAELPPSPFQPMSEMVARLICSVSMLRIVSRLRELGGRLEHAMRSVSVLLYLNHVTQ